MDAMPQFESPEAEFTHIRERVSRAAEQREGAPREEHEEKDIVRDVLREHIAQIPAATIADDTVSGQSDAQAVDMLVGVAFEKGILRAVTAARASKNPHLIDAFHDALIDRYYEKLVTAGVFGGKG